MTRSRYLLSAALAGLLATAAAAPSFAQTPIDNDPLDDRSKRRLDNMEKVMRELRSIVFQGRDTGHPVVVQPAETDNQIFNLNTKVDDLQGALQRLNGQIEVLNHDVDLARRQAQEANARLKETSDRLDRAEKQIADLAAAATPPPPPPPQDGGQPPGPAPTASAAQAFAKAKQLLLDGQYPAASAAFQDYVDRYGDTARAPEARYWLGETKFVQEAYGEAAVAYVGAIRGWPQTAWAPDAVVKLSQSLIALRKPADACKTLEELERRYPKASAAVKTRATAARARAKCAA
ncbi:tol-pal system protein YbgF [Caulobacter sp. CCUG 60055]|uniref:tol-pal system protein YbgF n=1 Tax=Caulobacter sp. CCUG 60055 TaxID=2100090 RepID=UPI001FA6EEE7|nr:tol-pal system protein YbgF [Caulobacter sp. CCUG 60055]MBQ1542937.1 tol-pal system protein YbgF [Caulobacteraceae bacterium]MCI3180152.1 tol-pal system protein YbgF [Caulobacter sp. CCUG 60055]